MIRVLMLCMGNICRSPIAEAVFKDMVEKAGLAEKISVDSAGTSSYHAGELAHPRTLQVLERNHIYHDGRSRQVRAEDFVKFDYILAMDRDNLRQIDHYIETSRAKVTLFLSYAYHAGLMTFDEVEDPYYNDRYEDTYEVIRVGCKALLDYLKERYRL